MVRLAVGLAVLLAGVPVAASAQLSPHLSQGFMACYQRAGDNTVQRDLCALKEVGAQDDRLNKAYQQLMRQLAADPDARNTLRNQERRWISERDYVCKVNSTTTDAACVVLHTASRADELESHIHF